jgi:putative ABC transport system permease protein
MDAELRFHIDAFTEDLVRSGVPREEARRSARIEFGGIERAKEECRDIRGTNFVESLFQDLRFALRMLRKSPVFAAASVLTLALGIGANTAIFSVVYAVLLRPLPFALPDQLVVMFQANLQAGIRQTGCSYVDFAEWRKQNRVFNAIAGVQRHQLTLTGHGEPSMLDTVVVTPEIFSLLQARPLSGRAFSAEDGNKGAAAVVILSENLWRNRFGADPRILGSSINLDQSPFTVVGIMPADFHVPVFTENQEIWIPLAQDPLFGGWMTRRGGHWLRVVGRLAPGVSVTKAQAEMDAVSARLAREFPAENAGWTVHLAPLQQAMAGSVRSPLLVLFGAVGLVLLIACVNTANLLLTRATSRAKEIALRLALGAARTRLLRQLLTESAALGLLGAIAGIILACWGVQALSLFLPPGLPLVEAIRVDAWVLGFALLLSVAASFGFGLAPALLAANSDLQTNLKEGGARTGEDGRRRRARGLLAASVIALALVLIVAAGLLLRSFLTLTSVRPGFNVEHVLKAEISLPRFQYSTPQQWTAFSDALLERIQAQPGLQDSALAVPLPLADGCVNLGFSILNHAPLPPGTPSTADYVSVSPGYFRVMGIPLLRGRTFVSEDSPSAPRVAIINEALARFYFPDQDPLGQRLVFGFPPDTNISRQIVGIVGDVRDVALHQGPGPMMYVPFAQAPFWGACVVARSPLAPSSVLGAIRQAVQGIDSNLPVTDVATMTGVLHSSVAQPRFRARLLSLFGVVALLLSAVGIFGVISYSVSSRTREFGIRVALGASPRSLRRMVLQEGLKLAAAGLSAGIIAALVLAQFLKSLLYGVGAYDPLTFVGAAILLVVVALAACYIPARRATRADPLVALRYE